MSSQRADTAELELKLGYTFKDKGLLMEALTHKSYHYENLPDSNGFNERLEFLGDSVLGLCIATELFGMSEQYEESRMSKIKSHIVKGGELSDVAQGLGLGEYLRLGKGESVSGGRQKASLLANVTEALIGAVYVEAGFGVARDMVMRLFRDRLVKAIKTEEYKDFKSELQELTQERFGCLPDYIVVSEEGPDHEKLFVVEVSVNGETYGSGSGRTKKEAHQSAAAQAYMRLDSGNK